MEIDILLNMLFASLPSESLGPLRRILAIDGGVELLGRIAKPTQVDDPANSVLSCRFREVGCSPAVVPFEIAARSHGVNEVVGRVDALQRGCQRAAIEHIRADHLCRVRRLGLQTLRSPRQASHANATTLQKRQQAASYVPGAAGQADQRAIVFHASSFRMASSASLT